MRLVRSVVEPGVERLRLTSWRGVAVGYDVSAYLVDDVLVDTGFPHARAALLEAVGALRPRGVVVTHWHEDHAGSVPALVARGVPVLMHDATAAALRSRPPIRFYRRFVWGRTARLDAEPRPFDPAPLELVHTPGHSEDHLAVWDPARRLLGAGDLILGVKVRIAHEHESPRALVASLRRAAALEPRLLLDAHRGPVSDAAAQLRAKADWTEETIARIEALGAAGLSAREIARRLFGGDSLVGWSSGGEYSRRAFVRAVLSEGGRSERP
jgi:glyoxylase-like metal-dependent hydrolase (beta-lactamase superfamily II)